MAWLSDHSLGATGARMEVPRSVRGIPKQTTGRSQTDWPLQRKIRHERDFAERGREEWIGQLQQEE